MFKNIGLIFVIIVLLLLNCYLGLSVWQEKQIVKSYQEENKKINIILTRLEKMCRKLTVAQNHTVEIYLPDCRTGIVSVSFDNNDPINESQWYIIKQAVQESVYKIPYKTWTESNQTTPISSK